MRKTKDLVAINEGLTALRKGPSGNTDPLLPVLEGVWLSKEGK